MIPRRIFTAEKEENAEKKQQEPDLFFSAFSSFSAVKILS